MANLEFLQAAPRPTRRHVAIEVTGIVTLDVMRSIRTKVFREVVRQEASRYLLDFRHAFIELNACEWSLLAAENGSQHALKSVYALLVPDRYVDAAWDYCERLNATGRTCLAFTDAQAAYRWLAKAPKLRIDPFDELLDSLGAEVGRPPYTPSRPRPPASRGR